MQTFKPGILTIAIAMTALTPAPASPLDRPNSMRRVSGRIVEVDRQSRTVKIIEARTGKTIRARVPEGQLVTLSDTANPISLPRAIPFEVVIRGLVVDIFVVDSQVNPQP